jgi:small GTP-binding protein
MRDAFSKSEAQVEYNDYYKYRISYITEKELELIFIFVTGLTDNFDNIKKELIKCKKEFLNLFEDILQHKFDAKTFEIFDATIDSIHKNLRPKISLVGFSGVGKTTITRLIKAEEIPMEHIPTITGDIATIKIGKLHFHLWDFAGQEQFSYLWNNFIKGSDAVLLITDSSLENVEKSKFFLELIKEQAAQAHTSVIGNKQDLDNAMKPEQIEKILGLKTYSMIAKDQGNRDKMITIIADILEMSAEVSPLLQPLLERDTYTEKAVKALEDTKFEEAAGYFEKISDLCIELGDDSLGKEFDEKAQKIRNMLQQASKSQKILVGEPKTIESIAEVQRITPKAVEPSPKVEPSPPIIEPKTLEETPPEINELKIPDAPKVNDLVKSKAPSVVPPPPGPPQKTIEEKAEEPPVEQPELERKVIAPPQPTEIKQSEVQNEAKPSEPEIIIKPKIQQADIGLNLNPEDFMVKQRPKTVTTVPKDAKNKLETSPFAHVSNPVEFRAPIPISSPENLKSKALSDFVPPNTSEKPIARPKPAIPKLGESETANNFAKDSTTSTLPPKSQKAETPPLPISTETVSTQQRIELEKSLIDLRIKKANLTKRSLDYDMQELTGEITPEELETKKQKLRSIESSIEQHIKDLEKLLGS